MEKFKIKKNSLAECYVAKEDGEILNKLHNNSKIKYKKGDWICNSPDNEEDIWPISQTLHNNYEKYNHKQELEKKGFNVRSYDKGEYEYRDDSGIYHLFRDGKEIAKGLYVDSYINGDYKYEDKNLIQHLFREGKEITKGKYIYSYPNRDYRYKDINDGKVHLKRDGKELLVCDFIYEIKDGVYECESTTKTTHNFNEGKKKD